MPVHFSGNTVLPSYLKESINSIVKRKGYKDFTIDVKPTATQGDNYLADLYEIHLKGSVDNKYTEDFIFFKKSIPDDDNTLLSVKEAYMKELFVYKDIFVMYDKLQNEAGVPMDQRFNAVKIYEESNDAVIILENLTVKGYKTLGREEVLTIGLAELMVQQLARYHGLSFVLKVNNPRIFEEKIKILCSPIRYDERFSKFVQNSVKTVLSHLNGDVKKKVEAFVENIAHKIYTKQVLDTSSGVNCLCHGDYRQSNVLVKEVNGNIKDVKVIDYQLVSYGCPLYDFLLLIITGTDQQFRRQHLNHLKELYFMSLSKFLSYFNIDIENVYPREVFDRDVKEKWDYGLLIAFLFFPFIFVSKDDHVDLTKVDLMYWDIKPSETFIERIKELIDDYVKWGYL